MLIMCKLPFGSLSHLRSCSRLFWHLSEEQQIWKNLVHKQFTRIEECDASGDWKKTFADLLRFFLQTVFFLCFTDLFVEELLQRASTTFSCLWMTVRLSGGRWVFLRFSF